MKTGDAPAVSARASSGYWVEQLPDTTERSVVRSGTAVSAVGVVSKACGS
ncbi:hypothetical protein [Corallococcus coralloides]|nr:hypothetical protein [Corallococcus coralloides]